MRGGTPWTKAKLMSKKRDEVTKSLGISPFFTSFAKLGACGSPDVSVCVRPDDIRRKRRRRFGDVSVSEANGTLPQVRLFVAFFSKPQQKSRNVWYRNMCPPPRFQTSNNSEIASWVLNPSTKKHFLQTAKNCFFLILSHTILFSFEGCRSQLSKNPPTNVACCHGLSAGDRWVVSWCVTNHCPMFFRIFSGHEPKTNMPKDPQKWLKQNPTCSDVAFWTCSKARCGNF